MENLYVGCITGRIYKVYRGKIYQMIIREDEPTWYISGYTEESWNTDINSRRIKPLQFPKFKA